MKIKRETSAIVRYLPTILIFILIAVIMFWAVSDVSASSQSEGLAVTEKSIRRAVITCYAQEGQYPESIEYLKENYGLKISDDYIVTYDIFSSNIMPQIMVYRKQVND